MDTNETVLVTGGAGFIGSALARRLGPRAGRWIVMDSLHDQVHAGGVEPGLLPAHAEVVVADVTSADAWDNVLRTARPDVVIHLAAETGTAQSLHHASRHALVNVVGTTQMLDAFGRAGHTPGRLLLSSSRAVYGEGRWSDISSGAVVYPGQRSHAQLEAQDWDFDGIVALPSAVATTMPSPTSVYGATKLAQESILSAWASAHDTELTTLRLQNVYGPGQSLINPYTGIVSLFSQLSMAGHSTPIYEDGAIIRDFVFIDDVVGAFEAVLSAPRVVDTRAFDVGSGVATSILELAQLIARLHAAPAPQITGAFRDGDVRNASCDIDQTTRSLNWMPQTSLQDGIATLQEWIRAELEHGTGLTL